jgi:hypothetical protein
MTTDTHQYEGDLGSSKQNGSLGSSVNAILILLSPPLTLFDRLYSYLNS